MTPTRITKTDANGDVWISAEYVTWLEQHLYKRFSNSGHGHVHPREDGMRARCGGPAICPDCALDQGLTRARRRPDDGALA